MKVVSSWHEPTARSVLDVHSKAYFEASGSPQKRAFVGKGATERNGDASVTLDGTSKSDCCDAATLRRGNAIEPN